MAGTITALKVQKRNKDRVSVFIDEAFAFGVTMSVALTLKKGQHLSDDEIDRLQSEDDRNKAYHRAIRYLGYRPRTISEMETYLFKKGYNADVVEDVLTRLSDEGYLDDEAFAEFWLENRTRFKPKGAHALRHELRQKGVSRGVIDASLDDLDEETLAWTAAQKKLRRWQSLEEEDFKKKLFGFLGRRGFTYEVCHRVFERAWTDLNRSE